MSAEAYVGLGFETTRGTGVVPTYYLPCEKPKWSPIVTWLPDEGLRGSPSKTYSRQAGVRHDTFEISGFAFLDTFPMLIRAMLGATDTVVAAPTSTTLAASATLGASTISTVATIAAGSGIVIGANGPNPETHTTLSVSGSGPYTVTLAVPSKLLHNQASGLTVTPKTAHTLGLVNSVAAASQPPSATISYFDAGAAGTTTARGMTYAMLDKLSITFASEGGLAYTASWITQAEADVSAPTETYSTEIYVPAWSCSVALGGTASSVFASGSIDIMRGAAPINTLGQQSPYSIFDGPIDLSGKVTFVLEQGATTMANGTLRDAQSLDMTFFEPTSQDMLDLHMNQIQLMNPVEDQTSHDYLQITADFGPEANTTDATQGGYSPLRATVANGVVAAY